MNATSADDAERDSYQDARAEYHASRVRYIRSVTSGVEDRLMERIGHRRDPIVEEITNLTLVAHNRYETYRAALKAYASKAPRRVTSGGLLQPSPAERMIAGVDKLYRAAVKAAAEFSEVNDIIKKRKVKLEEMDWKMRARVEEYGHNLIAQLETPSGLESAFKRDPLLGRAHARMVSAQLARKAS